VLPRGAGSATCCCCHWLPATAAIVVGVKRVFPTLLFFAFYYISFDEQLSSLSWLSKWRFILLAIFLPRHALFAFGQRVVAVGWCCLCTCD